MFLPNIKDTGQKNKGSVKIVSTVDIDLVNLKGSRNLKYIQLARKVYLTI
jgi:hypothetical protein